MLNTTGMRRVKFPRWLILAVAMFVIASLHPGIAQQNRATIAGKVIDRSGAVVPSTRIQIVETGTNVEYGFATNNEGLYTAPGLPPGTYKVIASKDGFSTIVRQPVLLTAQVEVRVDFTLEPGSVQQTVTVDAAAPLLDVSTTGNVTSLSSAFIHDMPVISTPGQRRDVTQSLNFVPGLVGGLNSVNDTVTSAKVNGSATGQTEVFLDGARGTEGGIRRGAIEEIGPPIDAVGEVTVVANAFNAEYGGFGSWFTQVTIKSGSNNLHGGLYDHFQNSALNARTFFQPTVSPLRQNEGGGNIGGPVYIPKIYDGRNRTFFFFNQGAFIAHQGASGTLMTVPTTAFMQGDFSKLVNAAGAQIPIFDPATTTPNGTGFARTQFPGNIIPTSRITQAAAAIIPFLPTPSLPGQTNNYYNHAPINQYVFFDIYNTTVKLDHSISSKQKFSVTYGYGNRSRDIEQYGYPTPPIEYHLLQSVVTETARINHDYIFNPSLLNHVTVAYDRYRNLGPDASQGGGWDQKLGIVGIPDNNSGAFPAITFSGGTASPTQMGRAYNERWGEQHFTLDESLTWTHGKHNLKFGVFYGTDSQNENQKGGDQGSFAFSNLQTSQPLNSTNGNSFASFLLGAVNSVSALFPTTAGMRYRKYAAFAQDEWRVTGNLTLSYGLRYDYNSPGYEINNHLSSFSPAVSNPGAGGTPGPLVFASGSSGFSRTFVNPWRTGFSPRLGLAYQLNKKTVLRASGGVYYAAISESGSSTAGFNTNATFSSPDNFSPAYYWTQPFPTNYVRPPVTDPSFLNGQAISWLNPQAGRMPQVVSWTFGIQRQLARDLSLDVAYIGSKSTHLPGFANQDNVPLQALSLGSVLAQQVGSAVANANGIGEPFPGFLNLPVHTVAQALRPYPQFTSVNFGTALNPSANANFNSLQIKATRRFSQGLQFLVFYVRQKTMSSSDISPQNPLMNRFQAMSISASDIPNTLQISATYELPFGPGRRFLNGSSPLEKRIVAGWQLTTTQRYQSGAPLSLTGSNSLNAFGYFPTANYIGGSPYSTCDRGNFDPATCRYLNPAAFSNPSSFAFGNTAPTLSWLRGPTQKSEALSLTKTTLVTEKVRLETGLDVVNPFNFVRWGLPNTSINSADFGKITYVQGAASTSGGLSSARTLQINAVLKF
jgi:hypothetical protein